MNSPFSVGDWVTWKCAGRHQIEFGISVPAVVRKLGAKRIQVEATRSIAYSQPKRFERVLRWVDPGLLASRACPCAVLGEELRMEVDGFVLTPWKHPVGAIMQFPDGIWYGMIDGYECTAPCFSADRALESAYHVFRGGAYRASLLTHISTYTGWLESPEPYAGEARTKLVDLHARLAKLDGAYPVAASAA